MAFKNQTKAGINIFVALSGGVDSAVSAALLKEAGYRVTGAFIDIWQPDFIECSAATDRRDAMRVAAKLGIDFLTVDCRQEYKQQVVDEMIAGYQKGQTPNPDVLCNSYIKFEAFYRAAKQHGADCLATGHYVRLAEASGTYRLLSGLDEDKDQSYFLWNINRQYLPEILFPVGEYRKSQVRQLARKFDLPVADKKDSQGVCFLGPVEMKQFLGRYLDSETGAVLDTEGRVIGAHDGAWFYTPGQRRGFKVDRQSPDSSPLYVIAKDPSQNTLTVAADRQLAATDRAELIQTNWFRNPHPDREYRAQARYRGEKYPCRIKFEAGRSRVWLVKDRTLLVDGQSLVLYDNEELLGGGIIRPPTDS